ncbi:phage terminase large subunit family protein [Chengkuizengella axinellae]|uniref:Phage terminase large subunit family protein n=1 Tax=Chengkuizengella axinellae TaxID=3064388 RepID=A0ABT9J6B2_9BACL|nr:phage terminase large subunit family protein [Chengkuizengella sp. 2205SS18-9]MDP5277156.1 phage terminase large subunit family protein [Chengkuizengella sp. 2205SS18-9]
MTVTTKMFKKIAKVVAPPPDLNVSDWADLYRRLSSESSSEPGQWRTDRAPYQREIMNAVNDPEVDTIAIMSSAQVGKTELILNTIGYFVDYDPSPIMVMQPTVDMAKTFSKDRLAPMLRDSPALKGKISDSKSRDSGNTMLHKSFSGGHVTMVGANSPSGLASRPIRILLADEVDRFPASAGTEGDPITLAEKRTTTFWNKKKIFVSTPTVKGVSRIEMAFMNSTQEHWYLPCPSCKEYQPLRWGQIKFDGVLMACKHCGSLHNEFEWKSSKGKWVSESPDSNKSIRGFHLNELVSPWKRWDEIIKDFKVAKEGGPEMLKAWVNTSLGETWEEEGEQLDEDALVKRREDYGCDIPKKVKVLTASVDVQGDRLECEVVGWGAGKESWGIEYRRFYGDPAEPAVWNELDNFLSRTWFKEDQTGIKISCTCIDSGGHYTTEVYRFCKKREHRRIFAIKGQGGDGVPLVGRMTRTKREKCALFIIGVDGGKELVMSRLKKDFEGPGYCHYPRQADKGYDEEYFRGITSEKRVVRIHKGRPKIEWIKKGGVNNEPLDLRNYATAALELLNPNLDDVQPTKRKPKRKYGVVSKGIT